MNLLRYCTSFFALLLSASSAHALQGAGPDHWVGTWAASPQAVANKDNLLAKDITLRNVVHTSIAGSMVRVIVTNELGTQPLQVGAAAIALSDGKDAVKSSTVKPLLFAGQPSVTLPPGTELLSDPVAMNLPAFADVVLSLYLPAQSMTTLTAHLTVSNTGVDGAGNQVAAKSLNGAVEDKSWHFVKEIDVLASADSGAVVTLGDSITDGSGAKRDSHNRWGEVLARRLQANKPTANLSVMNAGIGSNRILAGGAASSGLGRFDRDVLAAAGVRYLILFEGTNDINHSTPQDPVTSAELIMAINQIVDRAHTHGIKVIVATINPRQGDAWPDEFEKMRSEVNAYIRTSKSFDGMIDFDKATRDPAHPRIYLPAFDGGDHVHPNDAGHTAMGNAVDLSLFTK